MALSKQDIQAAKPRGKPYKLAAGEGLQLWILPGGAKVWRLRYRFHGKEKSLTLGHWPGLAIREASLLAAKEKEVLRRGLDPSVERQRAEAAAMAAALNTFEKTAAGWWTDAYRGAEDTARAQDCRRTLDRDAIPFLKDKPTSHITRDDIRAVLHRVWDRGAEYGAKRLLSDLSRLFRWAVEQGIATTNPTAGLQRVFRPRKKGHFMAVTRPERLAEIMRTIESIPHLLARSALQLLAMTLARPGEVIAMKWSDLDLKAGTWTRTVSKVKTELVTPLPTQAVAILERLRIQTGHLPYVFAGRAKNTHMAIGTPVVALKRAGIADHHAHGFRATGRTLLDEVLGERPDIVEQTLGHTVKAPNGSAYARMQFLPQRRAMLQRWADYLENIRTGGITLGTLEAEAV